MLAVVAVHHGAVERREPTMEPFLMCTLKIPVTTVKKIDSYRKHCLWRGNDVNSKKPALAAWSMITQTKKMGAWEW